MPLIVTTEWYSEKLLADDPLAFFIFGDNVLRIGKGGQAIIRDMPNAVGVATKWAPTMDEGAFFSDNSVDVDATIVANDLKHIDQLLACGALVYWPSTGIGTERAELRTRAPLLLKRIEAWRDERLAHIMS